MFLETDPARAVQKVDELNELNNRRRSLQQALCKEMFAEAGGVGPVFVAYNPNWPHGLVGIMAAKAVDRYSVPAFVFGKDHKTGLAYGSARSVPGFNLVKALESCAGLLERFGGHPAAAG